MTGSATNIRNVGGSVDAKHACGFMQNLPLGSGAGLRVAARVRCDEGVHGLPHRPQAGHQGWAEESPNVRFTVGSEVPPNANGSVLSEELTKAECDLIHVNLGDPLAFLDTELSENSWALLLVG